MIPRATIDKIIDMAEVVDVISDFVSLKRRGANYIACCPFHNEKTPSFSVSPSKGIYKCFGCGKAGNVISFVMDHETLSYTEAIKFLGKKYGIEVKEKEESAEEIAERAKHESLLIVSEFARNFYVDTLFNNDAGKAIGLSYFKEARGFSEETIRKFELGYAPNKDPFTGVKILNLAKTAAKAGYKNEFLVGAGLCIETNSGELVDKFYDRVMFPIHSLSGRVIAFGGRTLQSDKSIAKYVNSAETEIYSKSRSLYGIYFAKSAISKLGKCYLVEGYTDVISFHQAGIENVVSSSGTSLTSEQIRLIKRFTNKVTVLYDGDPAGIKASLRGIDMLLAEGMEVKVALFNEGEDPDSFARSHSQEEITNFLNEAETDFISFKHDLLAKDIEKDPIRKAELIREIIRTISLIPDQIVRTVYIEETAHKLDVNQEMIIQEVSKARREHIASGEFERKRSLEREKRRQEVALNNGIPAPEEEFYDYSDDNDSVSTQNLAIKLGITVPIVEPSEKELIYYLLKFGETIINFQEHIYIESPQPVMNISVSQYIFAELSNDDIEFQNIIHKNIYDLYFSIQEQEKEKAQNEEGSNIQERIQRAFFNHQDEQVKKIVLDIIYQEHTLTVKEYLKSLIPEENILGIIVPKSILIFKAKIAEYTYQMVMEQLGRAQSEQDTTLQEELLQQIKILMMVKNQFSKELNRLT